MQNKYSFSFTPLAFQDLDDALAYISEQLSNPQAATELLEEVEHTLASVCEFPYAFSDCSVYLISDQNIRHAMVKNMSWCLRSMRIRAKSSFFGSAMRGRIWRILP